MSHKNEGILWFASHVNIKLPSLPPPPQEYYQNCISFIVVYRFLEILSFEILSFENLVYTVMPSLQFFFLILIYKMQRTYSSTPTFGFIIA